MKAGIPGGRGPNGHPRKVRLALEPRVLPGASRPLEVPVAPGLAFTLPDDKGLVPVLVRDGAIAVCLGSPWGAVVYPWADPRGAVQEALSGVSDAAGERFLFSGRLEIVGGWGARLCERPLPSTPLSLMPPVTSFLHLHLARFESRSKGVLIAIGNRSRERVLFRGAFESPQHHVSGGQPAACHFSAWELALLEKGIDHVGGDAKHLGGQPSSQHPLLWCGVNSTLFGKQQLDQPPVSALVYNMPAQLHRVFQVVQGG